MSLGPRPELVAEGVVTMPGPWSRLVAIVALFLRLTLGLGLVNGGLAAALRQTSFGGPGGGRPMNPFTGVVAPVPPGLEVLTDLLPFVELGVGVALIFGIFTTIAAVFACALTLVTPLMMAVSLMVNAGIATAPNRFGFGVEFFLLGAGQSTLVYAALVLLSPVAINRYSMDALIFARSPRRIFARPIDPAPVGESTPPGDSSP